MAWWQSRVSSQAPPRQGTIRLASDLGCHQPTPRPFTFSALALNRAERAIQTPPRQRSRPGLGGLVCFESPKKSPS
jgi:hypothetical protein